LMIMHQDHGKSWCSLRGTPCRRENSWWYRP
jgi:hypothetical protein